MPNFNFTYESSKKRVTFLDLKVNESQDRQCRVTPHSSTGQNILKKILRDHKHWQKYWKIYREKVNVDKNYWKMVER